MSTTSLGFLSTDTENLNSLVALHIETAVLNVDDIESAGQITIDSTAALADAIRIVASNTVGGIDIDAGTGGISLDTTGGLSLDATSVAAASNITHVGAAGVDLIIDATASSLILDGGEAAGDAVQLVASNAAGGVNITAGTGSISLDTTGGLSLDATSVAAASNITHVGAAGVDLTIDATASSLILDGGEAAADAVQLVASNAAGGVNITAGTGNITLSTTGQTQFDGATFQAGSISSVTVLTNAESGTWFIVDQGAAFAITLPTPPSAGVNFKFVIGTAGANNVTISNGSAHLFGTISNDITSVIPATGTTLTFATGTAAIGDSVEVYAIDATHYFVKAITSAAGGITVA